MATSIVITGLLIKAYVIWFTYTPGVQARHWRGIYGLTRERVEKPRGRELWKFGSNCDDCDDNNKMKNPCIQISSSRGTGWQRAFGSQMAWTVFRTNSKSSHWYMTFQFTKFFDDDYCPIRHNHQSHWAMCHGIYFMIEKSKGQGWDRWGDACHVHERMCRVSDTPAESYRLACKAEGRHQGGPSLPNP